MSDFEKYSIAYVLIVFGCGFVFMSVVVFVGEIAAMINRKNWRKEEIDEHISKGPAHCCMHVATFRFLTCREIEAEIGKDPMWALHYAENVIFRPFGAGEAAIATDDYYSFRYARDVLEGRFEKGEAIIYKNGTFAALYDELIEESKKKRVIK